MSEIKIACCAIVKNEEEVLDRMLKSAKFMTDEYFIMDTGSTDSTKDIIRKYGNIYESPFVNFVDTKNKLLEIVSARTDITHILWLDADEYIQVGGQILLDTIKQYPDTGWIDTEIQDNHGDITTIKYTRKRVWLNSKGFRFNGPGIHEYLHAPTTSGIILRNVEIWHKHKIKNKDYRLNNTFYIKILKEAIDKDPTDLRGWFYLARTYKDDAKFEIAINTYHRYLDLAKEKNYTFIDELWQATIDIADCHRVLGQKEKMLVWYDKSINVDNRRAESYYHMANFYFYDPEYKDLNAAKKCCINALETDIPNDVTLFLNKKLYRETPLDLLSLIYWELEEWDKGINCLVVLLKMEINDKERIITNLKFFKRKLTKIRESKNIDRVIDTPEFKENTNKITSGLHTIDNYFDKIFCINLRKRPDRWTKVKKRLDDVGITKVERFFGYEGDLFKPFVDKNILVRRTGGYMGCLFSHLGIIHEAKRQGWKNVLILEDDIKIYKNIIPAFHTIANDVDTHYPNWDVLYLGHGTHNGHYDINDRNMRYDVTQEKYNISVVPAHNSWAAHAYAVSEKFYDVILNFYNDEYTLELDRWMMHFIMNKGRDKYTTLISYPQLFIQEANYSDNFYQQGTNHNKFLNKFYSTPKDYI